MPITTKADRDKAVSLLTTQRMTPEAKQLVIQSIKDFDEGIDTSPYVPMQGTGIPAAVTPGAPETGPYPEAHKRAAARGVNIDYSLPAKVGLGASFAANEDELANWYKKSLTDELGYEPQMRKSAEDGTKWEFLLKDKNTGKSRWTLIRPSSSLAFVGGQTALAAPEMIGSIAGGVIGTGLGPFGVAAGQAVGGAIPAGATDYAKTKLGQQLFGINQGVTEEQAREKARDAARFSASISLASDAAMWGLRAAKYWFSGLQPVNKRTAEQLLKDADEGMRLAKEINKYATPGQEVNFSIPQMAVTGAEDSGAMLYKGQPLKTVSPSPVGKEAMALQQQAMADQRIGGQLRKYQDEQSNALVNIYDNMAKEASPAPVTGSDPINPYEAGQDAVEGITQLKKAQAEEQLNVLITQEQAAREFVAETFPDAPPQQLAMETRKALQQGHAYFREQERAAWKKVSNMFYGKQGYSPMFVGVDKELGDYLRQEYASNAGSFLRKSSVLSKSKLRAGKPGRGGGGVTKEGVGELPVTGTPMSEFDLQFLQQFDPNAAYTPQTQLLDIGALLEDIKLLRNKERKAAEWGVSVAKVKELEEQLVAFRDRSLTAKFLDGDDRAGEVMTALHRAESASKQRADMFDQGLVKRLIKAKRDTFQTQDMTALGQMLAVKDVDAYDRFVRAVKASPGALQKLKQTFLGLYAAKAMPKGIPDPVEHAKFMDRYKGHGWALEKLFGPDELQELTTSGQFADSVLASAQAVENFDKAFVSRFGSMFGDTKLSDLSPDEVVQKVWSGGISGRDLRSFVALVQSADRKLGSRAMDAYKLGVLAELRRKIVSNGKLNLAAMGDILEKRQDALSLLFGPEFYKNFHTLKQAVSISEFTGASKVGSNFEIKSLDLVARATVAPPLTREGRLLTLGRFLRESNYKRNIAQVFTNPEALRRMAAYSQRQLTYQQWANALSKIYAIAQRDPDE